VTAKLGLSVGAMVVLGTETGVAGANVGEADGMLV
jgi:hypothetical protein